ncbi:MAG: type ISP restriction/modification enzyme [Armatimonadota bacterium]
MANTQTPKKLADKLAHILKEAHCVDSRAQAAAYGLFLRRLIPNLPVDTYLDAQTSLRIDDILDQSDLDQVFTSYMCEGKDPAVYFYEDFLRALDPANARARGVHYSPPSVVSYMTRCVDSILVNEFGQSLSEAVVVDPCCGTGAFLLRVSPSDSRPEGVPLDSTRKPGVLDLLTRSLVPPFGGTKTSEWGSRGHSAPGGFQGQSPWSGLGQSPKKLIGLELMETPAAIASRILPCCDIRRVDALDHIELDVGDRPLVIIGNPPYSGHSSNAGKLKALMADYKRGLKERNPKWLQDDYVKFIRMAQSHVESAGQGIVAFITNHSYLFNPTFRVMRQSLMMSFDRIYVLDMNGNAKINSSDGFDENVFPIQMGVAISFMIKTPNHADRKVYYARVRGSRQDKLDNLSILSFEDTKWVNIDPAEPFYQFTPVNHKLREEYYAFPSIVDLFEKGSVGFVTSRDSFAVDTNRDALLDRIAALRDDTISSDEIRRCYNVGDLDIESARQTLRDDPHWREKAVEVMYRPFDRRWAYLSRAVMERPRLPFMENLLRDNVALAIGRAGQVTGSPEWDVAFCTDVPADLNLFRRGGAMLYPKYVYVTNQRVLNLKPDAPNREFLFEYIYAMLHSGVYRRRYADFLASDYPRIPMIDDPERFGALVELGGKLLSLHLSCRTWQPDSVEMTVGGYKVCCGSIASQLLAIREAIDKKIAVSGEQRARTPGLVATGLLYSNE